MKICLSVVLALSSFFISTVNAHACAEILRHGIYDITSQVDGTSRSASFNQWFCSQNFSNSSSAGSFGASIGLPFEGLPIELGFNSSKQNWTEWYSKYCGSTNLQNKYEHQISTHIQKVNQALIAGFNSCIATAGLHVWLERTGDAHKFVIARKFNSPTDGAPAAVISDFEPGDNVFCKEERTKIIGPVEQGTQRNACTRKNDEAVNIIINSNYDPLGGDTLHLDSIVRRRVVEIRDDNPALLTLQDIDCNSSTKNSTCKFWVKWWQKPNTKGQQVIIRVGDNKEGYFSCGSLPIGQENEKLAPWGVPGHSNTFYYYLVPGNTPTYGCSDQIPKQAHIATSTITIGN